VGHGLYRHMGQEVDIAGAADQFDFALQHSLDTYAAGSFGNAGRNIARSDPFWQLDASLNKTFRMPWERMRLQFRAEVFNLPNHPIFGQPNSTLGNGFGSIGSTRIDSRQMQLGLKLAF